MKIIAIIGMLFLTIALLPGYRTALAAEIKPLTVGIVLPLTGPAAGLGAKFMPDIEKVKPVLSYRIRLFIQDTTEPSPYLVGKLVEIDKMKVIIGPTLQSALPTLDRYREEIFILPVFSQEAENFIIKMKLDNTFLIPEPLDVILSAIDTAVRKFGPSDLKNLKAALRMEVERNRQLYVTLDQKITALVLGGVNEWESEKGRRIDRNALEFLQADYAAKMVSYLKTNPWEIKQIEGIYSAVPKETKAILTETRSSYVTTNIIKSSGANGCESPPCKKYCCVKYCRGNDSCLKVIKCECP
jgi:hypothetical protein